MKEKGQMTNDISSGGAIQSLEPSVSLKQDEYSESRPVVIHGGALTRQQMDDLILQITMRAISASVRRR
jgi:hypothetical protein